MSPTTIIPVDDSSDSDVMESPEVQAQMAAIVRAKKERRKEAQKTKKAEDNRIAAEKVENDRIAAEKARVDEETRAAESTAGTSAAQGERAPEARADAPETEEPDVDMDAGAGGESAVADRSAEKGKGKY